MKKILILNLFIILIILMSIAFIFSKLKVDLKLSDKYLEECIIRSARRYNLNPYFIVSIIWAESRFYKYEYSRAKARGYMQITENTFRDMLEREKLFTELQIFKHNKMIVYETDLNIKIGCAYLAWIIKYKDPADWIDIVSVYNAGSNNKRAVVGSYILDIKNFYKRYLKKEIKYKRCI